MRSNGPLASMPADPAAALAPYVADRHGPWDARLAAHLLRRALGGGTPSRVARIVEQRPEKAIADLFRDRDAATEAKHARLGEQVAASGDRAQLAAWWLLKLASQDRAPGARLTLFWHDHFACGISKVQDLTATNSRAVRHPKYVVVMLSNFIWPATSIPIIAER